MAASTSSQQVTIDKDEHDRLLRVEAQAKRLVAEAGLGWAGHLIADLDQAIKGK